jgi:hypothetical protein
MGGATKHVLAGPRLRWCQWRASYGERYEKHHALPRAGDGTVSGREPMADTSTMACGWIEVQGFSCRPKDDREVCMVVS